MRYKKKGYGIQSQIQNFKNTWRPQKRSSISGIRTMRGVRLEISFTLI